MQLCEIQKNVVLFRFSAWSDLVRAHKVTLSFMDTLFALTYLLNLVTVRGNISY